MRLGRTRGIMLTLAAMLAVCIVCGGFVFLVAGDQIMDFGRTAILRLSLSLREEELNTAIGNDTTPVRFEINSGDSPLIIAQRLAAANLITDSTLFFDYVRAEGYDIQLEAGTYFLNQALTIPQIALRLTDSNSSQIPFRMLAGWRIEQVAEAIDANRLFLFTGNDFLAVVRGGAPIDTAFAQRIGLPPGASLEGLLLPGDYQLPPEATPLMLRETLTTAFLDAVAGELESQAAAQNWSLYDAVTLASIVQREAFHLDEQPRIAGAYRNRLNIGMKLDADPTVQYGLDKSRGNWWPSITQADYQGVVSNYNTYLVTGLPPSPIASPSLEALRAALNPTPSEFLYFRADCRSDGYHDFARTYEEHLENGC